MRTFDVGDPVEARVDRRWSPGTVSHTEPGKVGVRRADGMIDLYDRELVRPARGKARRASSSLRGAPLTRPLSLDELRDAQFAERTVTRFAERVTAAPKRPTVRLAKEAVDAIIAKRGPWRSPAYLNFVREMPCCLCGRPGYSDPSHHGRHGIGQKTDDARVIPLCRQDHDHFHRTGRLGDRTVTETRIFATGLALELVIEFLKRNTLSPLMFESPPCVGAASRRGRP